MTQYKIAAILGDGSGTEVVPVGTEVLTGVAGRGGGFELQFEPFDWVATSTGIAV